MTPILDSRVNIPSSFNNTVDTRSPGKVLAAATVDDVMASRSVTVNSKSSAAQAVEKETNMTSSSKERIPSDDLTNNKQPTSTGNITSSALNITAAESENNNRDIPTSPPRLLEYNGTRHRNTKLHALVAILLSESLKRAVEPKELIVADKLTSLKDYSKKIYAYLVQCLAKEMKTSKSRILKVSWDDVPHDIKVKYMLFLEEIALKKYKLAIARCKYMWDARCLLQVTSRIQSTTTIKKLLKKKLFK